MRAGLFGTLALALSGQALPDLPRTGVPSPDEPDFAALLPYRPYRFQETGGEEAPLQYRGEQVTNGPNGWIIEKGALESGDMLLVADHIEYDPVSDHLTATGNIRLEGQGVRLRCERLSMDWKKRSGQAWDLELELDPGWTLQSSEVAFASMKHWDFQVVKVTACPQERPGWSMTMSRLKLDLDHFATFRDAKLFIGPAPVLYLPWGTYPAKSRRSSGLLPTLPGYSTTLGVTLGLPYFQALGDRMDMTLEPVFYTRENPLLGGEFRWSPEPTHSGSVRAEYIHQRSDGQYRYQYQVKDLWQREDGWQFSADINQASDSLFSTDFGRNFGSPGSVSYDSALYLGKNYSRANFSVSTAEQRNYLEIAQDPAYPATVPTYLRKRTLPGLQSRMYPISLGNFYLDAAVRADRLQYSLDRSDDTPSTVYTWGRQDAYGRLQGRLGQWGPFRADLQGLLRFTRYDASLRHPLDAPQAPDDGSGLSPTFNAFAVNGNPLQRVFGSTRLQISGSPLGRNFENVHLLGYRGELKHLVEPFFGLTVNSKVHDVGYIPRFDEVDSRPGINGSAMGEQSLELGLMQHLMGRSGTGSDYTDLVRWKLSTKYHHLPILLSDGTTKRGWTSLDSALDAEPSSRLRISFRSTADIEQRTTDNSLSVNLTTEENNTLKLALYSSVINQLQVRQRGAQISGLQRFGDDTWRLEYNVNYNYSRIVSAQVGVAYLTPCLATSIRFTHLALNASSSLTKENRVDLVLSLRALGEFPLFSR